MTDNNRMRKGSLQFYPRVRAKKVIPSVNWKPISKEGTGFMGFVGYKAGMISVWAKDDTEASLTKGKRIAVPATVLECPPMKIYSIRFYKDGKVSKEFVVADDKELKRNVKLSKKKVEANLDSVLEYDDVRVIMFSGVKDTGIGKKKADLLEVGISGDVTEKLNFVKENVGKMISVTDVFSSGLVDTRGVTRGFGTHGPVKRFGIALKDHKSEKGRRRPGSLAPWHPARVTFRAPQAGQTGFHNRICYNNLVLESGKISEKDINKKGGFEHYGLIKTDYIILKGSVPGPKKRGIVLSAPIMPSKRLSKKSLEVVELR
ncbi:50S ribosomal protein L3 [archaeon]|jgi:large subunit ribosomal protein L3|nr:50S ribosomal protein L3 [archaeon]MBT6182768.1 50S ribosomal protein L3 [archaeon]MBT6606142.1 50S ribosomal protein L3 [archaeon]MBT7252018.1 50S ribosomal protein L3 [archaeon]MBT7660916.1 50S ribosomal protein L3 [archaeon]